MEVVEKTYLLNDKIAMTLTIVIKCQRGRYEFLFKSSDVTAFLGFKQLRSANTYFESDGFKTTWGDLIAEANGSSLPKAKFAPNTVFLWQLGLHALIQRSKLPEALDFQKWVFEEVLPSLRKDAKGELARSTFNLEERNSQLKKDLDHFDELMKRHTKMQIELGHVIDLTRLKLEAVKADVELAGCGAEIAKCDSETAKGQAKIANLEAEKAKRESEMAKRYAEIAKRDVERANRVSKILNLRLKMLRSSEFNSKKVKMLRKKPAPKRLLHPSPNVERTVIIDMDKILSGNYEQLELIADVDDFKFYHTAQILETM